MSKTILITGSTDGIGLETAKMLVAQEHHVLLHGRSREKLKTVQFALITLAQGRKPEIYVADLSVMSDVEALAKAIAAKHARLDVLINNAGVYSTSNPITQDGLDVRFVVNAIAPYLLTQKLLPLLGTFGRVINLSSAAQSSVDLNALDGQISVAAKKIILKYKKCNKRDRPDAFYTQQETETLIKHYRYQRPVRVKILDSNLYEQDLV